MVAPLLGAKAGLTGRAGGAVGRHPAAEARGLADEAALGVGRLHRLPGVGPLAVDEHEAEAGYSAAAARAGALAVSRMLSPSFLRASAASPPVVA